MFETEIAASEYVAGLPIEEPEESTPPILGGYSSPGSKRPSEYPETPNKRMCRRFCASPSEVAEPKPSALKLVDQPAMNLMFNPYVH